MADRSKLKPGTVLRAKNGRLVTLDRRKGDKSGWWNTDGSGFSDYALEGDSWVIHEPEPDYPECVWCGEAITGREQVRVDRWYLHDGCIGLLEAAVSNATYITVAAPTDRTEQP